MVKRLSIFFAGALLLVATSKAQWVNEGAWPDTSLKGQLHGLAVDPDGKVWASDFGAAAYNVPGTSDTVTVLLLRVFNPDGSEASFSPIWKGTVNGAEDTLKSNNRGMAMDHQGNIVLADGARVMRRFNYQTGEIMNRVVLQMTTSPVAPGIAENGNIFVGPVVNAGQPIEEYDADFNYLGNVVNLVETAFTRAMEVSKDANTIYFPQYSLKRIIVYQRPDEFSAFDSIGTIMDGVACESIAWNETTGLLWISGGSFNDLPLEGTTWTPNTWYAYDVAANAVVDSLKWTFTVPDAAAERPRAIDFSPDGKIAYIGCFGGAGYPLIQKVVNTAPDGVERENDLTVRDYSLSQNYPNPFNPTTEIKFAVVKEGLVTLKVYDMLGREVVELVNENMSNGNYAVDFDASNLASGTYVYHLQTGDVQLTKKMMLLK